MTPCEASVHNMLSTFKLLGSEYVQWSAMEKGVDTSVLVNHWYCIGVYAARVRQGQNHEPIIREQFSKLDYVDDQMVDQVIKAYHAGYDDYIGEIKG